MTDSTPAPKFTVDASHATGVLIGDQGASLVGSSERAASEARRRTPLRVFGAIPMQAWNFQDRRREASQLHEALKGRNRAALVAMPGERGAGKSQIAAAYARSCVESGYDLVAWINAESGPVTELAQLALQLGVASTAQTVEEQAAAACRWLGQPGKAKRLIVFDNVDDPDAITDYLPRAGPNKVIITTNRREFATMGGITSVPVGMFTRSEGLAFLRQATELPSDDDAVAVAEELGWLPLGLAQAAAYIVQARLSYRDYLTVLEQRNLDDILQRQAGADHPGVLKATQLNISSLERNDPTGSSVRLLAVLSLLSADGISRALLAKAEGAWA